MALIKCPECSNMVSNIAGKCPSCGAAKKDTIGLKIVMVIAMIGVAWWFFASCTTTAEVLCAL